MRDEVLSRTFPLLGTLVTIQVVGDGRDGGEGGDPQALVGRDEAIGRAFDWFHRVERCCSRFDAGSEVMQATGRIGVAVPVSAMLFEAVRFALDVAEETNGAFDPTVGHRMEMRGFNREHRTGTIVRTAIEPDVPASYRDVELDPERMTITLRRPLILDLGAVAKGLAIDMAARELAAFSGFAIDAGGDLYLGGLNPDGLPWSVGIRHPRQDRTLIDAVTVSNRAVCTSGDYERKSAKDDAGHHIIDPRTGESPDAVASVTVVAPGAMLADALATAAFVMGPADGIELLERHGVDGLIISPTLARYSTKGMDCDVHRHADAVAS